MTVLHAVPEVTDVTTAEVPLYTTECGGYAAYEDGKFVWHSEIPYFLVHEGVKIGDEIPEDWDTAPVNNAAHREMKDAIDTDPDELD